MESLFSTIFEKDGIYKALYTRGGSSPSTKRTDIRLGEVDENDASEAPTTPTTPKGNFFSQEIAGFPTWLLGIFLLGFAWAYRRRKKADKIRTK